MKAALSGVEGTGGLSEDDVQALAEQFSSRAPDRLDTAMSLMSIVPDVVERLAGGAGDGQDKPGGGSDAVPADVGVTSPG